MKMLILVITLVSSTVLANRILTLDKKVLMNNLTKLAGSKMQNILATGFKVDSAKLDQFVQKHLLIDILESDRDIAMALLPKSVTTDEELDLDKVTVSYDSYKLRPEGLHVYLVDYLNNKVGMPNDGNIFLLAQYSPSYLAMHEIKVVGGEIELGSATYYKIDRSQNEPSVQETELVNALMEDRAELPEDRLDTVAFARLFSYHTQGKSTEEIMELVAEIQKTFFPQEIQLGGADAKNGNGSGAPAPNVETTPTLQDFASIGKEFGKTTLRRGNRDC